VSDRGQLVLLAAAAIAVALVPLALAHLQLAYHADVGATGVDDAPVRDGERTLDRALQAAVDGIPAQYPWGNRSGAVTAVRGRLESDLATLNVSGVTEGTAYGITFNATRAGTWASRQCPDGPARQFGPCRADRGIVVQERLGETHVLAAAVDIRVTTATGEFHAVTVLRVGRDG
jgi:hypothetical protein